MIIELNTQFQIKHILAWVEKNRTGDTKTKESLKVRFNKFLVDPNSHRYWNFLINGTTCVNCGLKGAFFKLSMSTGQNIKIDKNSRWHFNLYGIHDKNIILITKDHIIPKSKNGKNHIDNYQPMCLPCNSKKANKIPLKLDMYLIKSEKELCLIK